jgi:hypothetical protein
MTKKNPHRFPNLTKVLVNILEAKIGNIIGKETVGEIKKPYLSKELRNKLNQSIISAEKHFISQHPSDEISQALQQLPIGDLPVVQSAIWAYFENPSDTKMRDNLGEQLEQILPQDIDRASISNALQTYVLFLNEQLSSIPEIQEKLKTLMLIRMEKNSKDSVRLLESIDEKIQWSNFSEGSELNSQGEFQDQSTLVKLFSEDFVGRQFVFDSINQFITNSTGGYFIIEGDPGMGKSAIIAQFIKNQKCIAHFNNRATGVTNPATFLENVSTQLITRYSLPYKAGDVSQRIQNDGRFLLQVLDKASETLKSDEKIVIAIDALDEVENANQTVANILFLPTQLSENIFFVMSTRREPVKLVTHAPLFPFDLQKYPEQNENDAREYVSKKIAGSNKLQEFIKEKGIHSSDFINQLAHKSETNFMYLKSVLTDMQKGWYFDLELSKLPQGLSKYYEDHWFRMGMTGDIDSLKTKKLKIIYVLAAAIFPVSRQELAAIVDTDEILVQSVLNEWEQYLHVENENEENFYSIYHHSFREFLYRKDIVNAAKISHQYINAIIARKFKKSLNL